MKNGTAKQITWAIEIKTNATNVINVACDNIINDADFDSNQRPLLDSLRAAMINCDDAMFFINNKEILSATNILHGANPKYTASIQNFIAAGYELIK